MFWSLFDTPFVYQRGRSRVPVSCRAREFDLRPYPRTPLRRPYRYGALAVSLFFTRARVRSATCLLARAEENLNSLRPLILRTHAPNRFLARWSADFSGAPVRAYLGVYAAAYK